MRFTKASIAAAAACVSMMVASSQAAVTPPSTTDLTIGDWELNAAKSNFGCGKAPLVSKRHIIDAGWGLIVVEWTGTQADGKPFMTRYAYRYDGQKYPMAITKPDAKEAIIYSLANPHHVDFKHVDKTDKVTSTYTRDVSEDGQTMTQVNRTVGKTCDDVQVFERR